MMFNKIEKVGCQFHHELDEGHAEAMGGGMFIVFQTVDGVPQSVALSTNDLAIMLEAA